MARKNIIHISYLFFATLAWSLAQEERD